ncbi:DUF6333 family protein [Saccharothrix sp. ST-888]|uniref:DUF6333 family protein n=1 Tax=Saccharothrix sp. ST-888 TaxID=1427391 RepID=UPI0005EC2B04|nr:DUF6333 family protein [Saccharothrix sp. ST-888]KJK58395.1 hypothetical protein UK12_10795 [Saccharothrix sp. ST-888]
MTDIDHWDLPPDREVDGFAECTLTLVLPPFAPHSRATRTSVDGFAPHDPTRARAFVESFPTVEAVLDELPPTDAGPEHPGDRADLDLVRVGCWGNVIAMADFAITDFGDFGALLDTTTALAERFPDARIIGSASLDGGAHHVETVVHLPGGLRLYSEGWADGDRYDLDGDPHAIARAVGIAPEVLAARDFDLDGAPWSVGWTAFGHFLLEPYDPWGYKALRMSHFRVRHTEDATLRMEDVWFRD